MERDTWRGGEEGTIDFSTEISTFWQKEKTEQDPSPPQTQTHMHPRPHAQRERRLPLWNSISFLSYFHLLSQSLSSSLIFNKILLKNKRKGVNKMNTNVQSINICGRLLLFFFSTTSSSSWQRKVWLRVSPNPPSRDAGAAGLALSLTRCMWDQGGGSQGSHCNYTSGLLWSLCWPRAPAAAGRYQVVTFLWGFHKNSDVVIVLFQIFTFGTRGVPSFCAPPVLFGY